MAAYGSINIHDGADDVICDEETALIGEKSSSSGSRSAKSKKTFTSLFITLAIVAVVAFVSSGASPLHGLAAVGDGDMAPAAALAFNWSEWGAKMHEFWAEKKAEWNSTKTDLASKNATAAEVKEAKTGYWNSTFLDFGQVMNVTAEAEAQAKEAAAAAAAATAAPEPDGSDEAEPAADEPEPAAADEPEPAAAKPKGKKAKAGL